MDKQTMAKYFLGVPMNGTKEDELIPHASKIQQ